MIQHVWERSCKSGASDVIIATDDLRIVEICQSFGAKVQLTRSDHQSGTDRLAEVLQSTGHPADTIVVNVQGDEPLIPPSVIRQVAANLANNPMLKMATLAEPIESIEEVFNSNVVKVVTDSEKRALTFSRSPLPESMPKNIPYYRHIGIYAYRACFLAEFVSWGSCWLENAECLEQLRALWHGVSIHVDTALESLPAGVDTLQDLERVRAILLAQST
ncbi:UNVERIFIED_CONTAM: hypothetical protein GTU68_005051 [Idotea baltica]|nr:hypothetical protein [Idotea baltica]